MRAAPKLPGILLATNGFTKYYHEQAVKQCKAEEAEREKIFNERETAFEAAVKAALLPDLPLHGQCTDISGLLYALMRSGARTILLISDLEDSCARKVGPFPGVSGYQVIALLVRSRGNIDQTAPATLLRAADWKKRVPTLIPMTPSQFGDDMWRRNL